MEEVDKIIMHQLHQIDVSIEPTDQLDTFTPELVVQAVSSCLREINPKAQLPSSLPGAGALAQRFSIATTLAECCKGRGYHGEVGYQTFLYPNAVELRRLFMFLIEHLPREREVGDADMSRKSTEPLSASDLLQRQVRKKLAAQLKAPWVPQFCRAVGNSRRQGCSSQYIEFEPQLNLNVPASGAELAKELQQYFDQQAPNLFQQTASSKYDLIASVLHKNELERWGYVVPDAVVLVNAAEKTAIEINEIVVATSDSSGTTLSTTDQMLSDNVHQLRNKCDTMLAKRKSFQASINDLKTREIETVNELKQLKSALKLHERTCLVLADPKENVAKLKTLLGTFEAKRQNLMQQWQEYRRPLLETLEGLKTIREVQHIQGIEQLKQELRLKAKQHNDLKEALRNLTLVAPRKEYTRRIHEFIGNINKQRADIFKVLEDTRQLQKQLNVVEAQLQRQFNYTDDLLFQSAKHDLHAKKAYKLLAQLHANCNVLVECITLTGNVSKEIRELEVQIGSEKLKNVITSLQQITADIQKFEQLIQDVQIEIRTLENAITAG